MMISAVVLFFVVKNRKKRNKGGYGGERPRLETANFNFFSCTYYYNTHSMSGIGGGVPTLNPPPLPLLVFTKNG
jgi:hypothetical protein